MSFDLINETARWASQTRDANQQLTNLLFKLRNDNQIGRRWIRAAAARAVDLTSVSLELFDSKKFMASAIVARAAFETIGMMASFSLNKPDNEGALEAFELLYMNSSEAKKWEFKKGNPSQLSLTQDAMAQYGTKRPVVELGKAVNALAEYMNKYHPDGNPGEDIRPVYSFLSEITHPSQMSITHWYTDVGKPVPTSHGLYSIKQYTPFVVARTLAYLCIAGMILTEIHT